jgi:RHS repeat-associated protein
MLPLDWRSPVCAPVAYFTPPVWGLDSYAAYYAPLLSWHVYDVFYPDPWPAFSSVGEFVQAYVTANPQATACGTRPEVIQGFTFINTHIGLYEISQADTGLLAWTDPVTPNLAYWPTVPAGREPEEASILYKWIVPNADIPHACEMTVGIPAVRRRIAVCPDGYNPYIPGLVPDNNSSQALRDPQVCVRALPFDAKNLGACTGPNQTAGNPVSIATGNKYEVETDIPAGPSGALGFQRHYNSIQLGSWELGPQWRHTYDRSVSGWSAQVFAVRSDGKRLQFSNRGGQWTPDDDVSDRLYQLLDASSNPIGWRYVTTGDDTEIYDVSGRLQSIRTRNGATQALTYSTGPTPTAPVAGLLTQVVDDFGRQVSFVYDAQARIAQVTDPLGQVYRYAYDAGGNLATVTYPDSRSRTYIYNETQYTQGTNLPWALTGIVDENGNRYATFSYDSFARAVATEHAGGVDRYQFTYQSSFPLTLPPVTIVTDPSGTQRTYNYTDNNAHYQNTSLSQPCASCGGVSASAITYDSHGNAAAVTDFRTVTTTYAYDLTRNLQTSRTEGGLRTIQTQWTPAWRLPAQITEPAPGDKKTTMFTYDASGNMTQKSITGPKNDGTGAIITRSWQWSYGTLGRVLTATDPDGNGTAYTYYSDSDPDLGKRGNVATITNAVGHVTQFTGYDAGGRPLAIADPNGLVTTLTYHPRGWMTSRQVGSELTRYTYDGVGQLTQVTLPDGSYLQYAYDAAHRLTQINDGLGNKIVYTLDAMGNRVGESAYDQSGQLARTRTRQFDALNRLAADLGAQGQTTAYTYDNNRNLLTSTDPLSHSTGRIYDALNRLTQVLDPNLGVTKYAYDLANNLTQVTDPRTLATTYTYDGLNNLVRQISPDTGTTNNTYDAAGNLITRTDARGFTATYIYDGINRATQVTYSNGVGSEVHRFQYDIGTHARGRLTQVTDTSGFTNWTHNNQGRVASKSQTVDAFTKTQAYAYNTAGQLASITTPSGQQLGYGYLNNRIANVTVNGQTLLQGAATTPLGPISAWHWGNGLFEFRDYDKDGRLATWEFRNGSSLLRKDQTFDAASRITAVNDPNVPGSSQAYQYDVLDRLTVAQAGMLPTHTKQFAYDAVGNRLNVTLDSAVTNFAYSASSNRLQTLSGALPPGYLLGAGTWSFTYNNANRLTAVQSGVTTIATYRVNALGQRVSKNVGGLITYFVYDEQGHLLGEYDGAGNLIQETVWLEDLPVATLRPTGTGNPTPIAVYYVHADHLGSPRAVTRPSENAIMWQWDNVDPFGTNAANENPAGQGAFRYALRFPGQYYDVETATHYNYYRDYDPKIGRYEQSDPMGLSGGINTFSYVGDPIDEIDPIGLARRDVPKFDWGYGCGNSKYGAFIPDNPLFFPFRDCCRAHDNCYDDCKNRPAKQYCDDTFCSCMKSKCRVNPGMCVTLANYYCEKGTRSSDSGDSFQDSRKKCDGPSACNPQPNAPT